MLPGSSLADSDLAGLVFGSLRRPGRHLPGDLVTGRRQRGQADPQAVDPRGHAALAAAALLPELFKVRAPQDQGFA